MKEKTEKRAGKEDKLMVAVNKKARHNYEILDRYEAGIVLTGTEVKSLRAKKCNIEDGYATFEPKYSLELILINLHIQEYAFGNRENHIPKRKRKLLLHKRELIQLKRYAEQQGLTIIPLSIYFTHGIAKVELAVAKGRKEYDKREFIKREEMKREMRRGE
ncbi:SsrA-binding protein SmpB [Ignavibacteria bacterium]|nr:SsrA-binding protein SmpB [Bacteroidota bacterium]MCZ2132068.1 SsrA-binding protein SmpB [Bacteroidota bacterium]